MDLEFLEEGLRLFSELPSVQKFLAQLLNGIVVRDLGVRIKVRIHKSSDRALKFGPFLVFLWVIGMSHSV